jgi:hypothetical protein
MIIVNNMEHRNKLLLITALALTFLSAGPLQAEKVYRWVDENGEVHYSASLPPDFKDEGHDVLNERGIVLDEDQKLTPPSPEEKLADEVRQELPRDASGLPRAKALYSDAELQQRMDNFLMLRYESEQEIVDAMNVEIKQLSYDRRLLETSRDSMQQAYRSQIRQAAEKQRAGIAVDDSTGQEIDRLQARLAENAQSLAGLEQRETNIRDEFKKQLDRYRFLVERETEESAGR